LREAIRRQSGAAVGVVINDSLGRAWRRGTVGTALGSSGLAALLDLRGAPDRHGRALKTTEVGLADEIAAAASLLMGQAGEGRPIVLVRGAPYPPAPGRAHDLVRTEEQDLFR
jgi:coenzyme F420-0:L-glutamate ligase/coenzyme F420-1:gamma-L-glutamate ligase